MNKQKLILAFLLVLAISVPASAQKVYKRVNEDGTIEFSDTPSSDADKIDVKPNVVETNPIQPREASAPKAADKPEPAASAAAESAEPPRLEDEGNREAVVDPNPGRATRNAVRRASGP